MARSTVHYADSDTNRILKRLHNKLRPAGVPVLRVPKRSIGQPLSL
jgi:hypothetical protein